MRANRLIVAAAAALTLASCSLPDLGSGPPPDLYPLFLGKTADIGVEILLAHRRGRRAHAILHADLHDVVAAHHEPIRRPAWAGEHQHQPGGDREGHAGP